MLLNFNLQPQDLYDPDKLAQLDGHFLGWLREDEPDLCIRLERARHEALPPKEESQLLIDLAPWVEDFLGELFYISSEINVLNGQSNSLSVLARCKRHFIQRGVAKNFTREDAQGWDGPALKAKVEVLLDQPYSDLAFAQAVATWEEAGNEAALEVARKYAAWELYQYRSSPLFQMPQRVAPLNLIQVEEKKGALSVPDEHMVEREGFDMTDPGVSLEKAYLEAHYCIWCHNQEKDSCSKGLHDRKTQETVVNENGIQFDGCPLDEKVSEMNLLRAQGNVLGALAVAMVENPLIAGTGHRICNDCMKACIFQKQEPVNIPAIETQTLDSVLALPYGFEVYSLLSRWNPLNLKHPLPQPHSGYQVLVAGMGPAGYTLAHYLMNGGHEVVGIDGLKIEPLLQDLLDPAQPIKDVESLYENLSERVMGGFGGVAEYGITVRWNKNYLKVIRLLLERRAQFQMQGGVRLGGTLSLQDCQAFDHVALCMGAGRPTFIPLKNAMARGVRMASDFLMTLQLTGAAKPDSIANLQVRLPIVVVGGGLTAIDTATEALAYYPVQVEKFARRYAVLGGNQIREGWSKEENQIADEFLEHARILREERKKDTPRIRELLQAWGGATVVYRKTFQDSPSYRLNHEEVAQALEQGVRFMENESPQEVEVDEFGHAKALKCSSQTVPAKTLLIAAGTHPNTTLAEEDPAIQVAGEYFERVDSGVLLKHSGKVPLSFFGDSHPDYAGNVVKAMASAKDGYPQVDQLLRSTAPQNMKVDWKDRLQAVVHKVDRLTPTILEVIIKAPQAAEKFHPGQFYRLQNYETYAPKLNGTTLAMEGLAMTGAWVDKDEGLISVIVLEMGGSSDICKLLKPGEPVVLMGPTGTPTEIPQNETVLLVGGGLGNAVLFSIGKAMRENGCRVLYFAGYKKQADRYKVGEIEEASDQVVWCCDESPGFEVDRSQDSTVVGNMVEGLLCYARNPNGIPLQEVDRILTVGSDGMMRAVAEARHGALKPFLKENHIAMGSINSPMQCMMKGICAQCLQPHQDPKTGEISVVYSCSQQDQPLDWVDFKALHERLGQNQLQEKVTALWVQRCIESL